MRFVVVILVATLTLDLAPGGQADLDLIQALVGQDDIFGTNLLERTIKCKNCGGPDCPSYCKDFCICMFSGPCGCEEKKIEKTPSALVSVNDLFQFFAADLVRKLG